MKVLFWVPYPTEGASNRYRVEQYLPYIKKAGIDYSLHSFWSSSAFKILYDSGYLFKKCYYFILGTISRLFDLLCIFKYDLIFIHRESYPIGGAFFEAILFLLKKPYVYDFDDAIFLPSSSNKNIFIERFKNPKKVAKIIKMSQHVIAGNRYLSDFVLHYNKNVSVIPTPIDTKKYYPRNEKCGDKTVIGWIGSVTTLDFLGSIRNVFISISKQFRNVQFKIVGGDFSIPGLTNINSKPWSLNEELEDLQTFDIGIMPIPENEWTKGKCGFKAILYMSMSIPCVCSSIGVNKEIIIDGENGFLASSEDEWFKKLSMLIDNFEFRKNLGRRGRKTVEEKYSVKVNAPRFLEIFQEVYNKKYL